MLHIVKDGGLVFLCLFGFCFQFACGVRQRAVLCLLPHHLKDKIHTYQ